MRVLITGAAGNLGSRISRHLAKKHDLRLLIHKSVLPADLVGLPNVSACRGDLAEVSSLYSACAAVDCVIHLAGVLFAPNPESFLPHTNLEYVQNLIKAAKLGGVRKFILVSFPHVEGETTPEHPATDRLDATSQVVHFRTRLEAEKIVLGAAENFVPVILRSGVVYGKGIKLIEAARWLLRYRMLAVWRRPTWIHLIALPDFLAVTEAAVEKDYVRGTHDRHLMIGTAHVNTDNPRRQTMIAKRLHSFDDQRNPMNYPILKPEELFPSADVDDTAERKSASIRYCVDRAVDGRLKPSLMSTSTLDLIREPTK